MCGGLTRTEEPGRYLLTDRLRALGTDPQLGEGYKGHDACGAHLQGNLVLLPPKLRHANCGQFLEVRRIREDQAVWWAQRGHAPRRVDPPKFNNYRLIRRGLEGRQVTALRYWKRGGNAVVWI
jgi:hypothetical protein